ncbi:hypothetical protein AXZ95_3218 [Leifsonia sp. 115AMFTsu3.1]|nr:hypothetical protein AXZ95_3218 [Leifsonia sp. 115AMFTsu3.1]
MRARGDGRIGRLGGGFDGRHASDTGSDAVGRSRPDTGFDTHARSDPDPGPDADSDTDPHSHSHAQPVDSSDVPRSART